MSKLFFIITLLISNLSYAGKYLDISAQTIKYQETNYLVVNFFNKPKWHTYWKNPGDAGLPIKIIFKQNGNEVKFKELNWPSPKRYIEQGDLWAYGYDGEYSFFYELNNSHKEQEYSIDVNVLICKDICVPDQEKFNLNFDSNLEASYGKKLSETVIINRLESLPVLGSEPKLKLSLVKSEKENQLALHYIIEDVDSSKIDSTNNILIPYPINLFDFKHEESYFDSNSKSLIGRFYIDWDGIYQDPEIKLPEDGQFTSPVNIKLVLSYPKGSNSKIIEQEFLNFELYGDKALSGTFQNLSPLTDIKQKAATPEKSFWLYLLFAFLGGLILNIMPCVLPVISLKLFSLISHGTESKSKILRHNLFYTLGVLLTFSLLAITVILLKQSGESVGWGFQLTSPLFVYSLLVLVFVFGLNMFGLFEFRTPGGKYIANLNAKTPYLEDILNGVFATILSTPCSAPFLGTALGFAFTTSSVNIFLVFLAIGIGLAFPFILTGVFPQSIKFLPKPGNWMNQAKYFLGLSLMITAIWLIDVLFSLINNEQYGVYILLNVLLIFFAIFVYAKVSKNKILLTLLILFPLIGSFWVFTKKDLKMTTAQSVSSSNWKPWTPELMASSVSNKKATFIDFTASWCLTCKVNKKLVLDTKGFTQYASENEIQLIRGDWSKQDPKITKFLNQYNVVGVPAYFVITKSGEVKYLGETLRLGKIKKSFD